MADISDLERAVDDMLHEGAPLTTLDEAEYWRLKYHQSDDDYWTLKAQFDRLIDGVEKLIRKAQQ